VQPASTANRSYPVITAARGKGRGKEKRKSSVAGRRSRNG
jgi:hypothetical protein